MHSTSLTSQDEPVPKQPNQHLPTGTLSACFNTNYTNPSTVPDHLLKPLVQLYWSHGVNDMEMVILIKRDVRAEENGWSLSRKTIARRRLSWNYLSVRQQRLTPSTLGPHIEKVRQEYPSAGAGRTKDWLRQSGIHASRHAILQYNREEHFDEVQQRTAKLLKRKHFWTSGVFAVVGVDQHDKWGRYGLHLHLGVELFSGAIQWLKVWSGNKNPRLIFSYYLEMVRRHHGIPMFTQSDRGTENYGIANGHTWLRQRLDPSLNGLLQHKWMGGHRNVKPEIKWSQLRREFSPGWENLLAYGLNVGWYDTTELLDKYVFRWIAVPFLQGKLDAYMHMYNTSKPRADRNKTLPIGRPYHILHHPELYGKARDFKILANEEDFRLAEEIYAPPDHAVFQLVPPEFHQEIQARYQYMGSPPIELKTFWPIYLALRGALSTSPGVPLVLPILALDVERENSVENEVMVIDPRWKCSRDADGDLEAETGHSLFDLTLEAREGTDPQLIPEIEDLLEPVLTQI
ncbi:hypothetical protein CALCODRAFT_425825 [Calocera cornea HHB12733]|uniref:Integrase core domain-containing protein n=1 Tax=Calocera cornea HHB12733 TaxID=1353952 RepID=A0A165K3U2_9BASI|nr:hypothetical protein CALCODRAFT_425825 [Calocera cornea HHB12733]